jgi:hypothetical protein
MRYWLAAALLCLALGSLFFTGGASSKSSSSNGKKTQEIQPADRSP